MSGDDGCGRAPLGSVPADTQPISAARPATGDASSATAATLLTSPSPPSSPSSTSPTPSAVILIEPWFGESHAALFRGIAAALQQTPAPDTPEVHLLTLPATQWQWRLRLGALHLAPRLNALLDTLLARQPPPAAISLLCSDYVNLPLLLALVPRLRVPASTSEEACASSVAPRIRLAVFFLENQLTYPRSPHRAAADPGEFEFMAQNVTTCLCADRVVFCSQQQLEAMLAALPSLLAFDRETGGPTAPPAVATAIRARACVIPIGVDLDRFSAARCQAQTQTLDTPSNGAGDGDGDLSQGTISPGDPARGTTPTPIPTPIRPLRIVWPHRFEPDKNPEDFFAVVTALRDEGLAFELAVLGKSRRNVPACMLDARTRLGDCIVQWGHLSGPAYPQALAAADVVVSTAWQETQGLAVIEAIRAGCFPLLPDRLSYPEVLGPELVASGRHLFSSVGDLRRRLRWMIKHPDRVRADAAARRLHTHMDRFGWRQTVGEQFRRLLLHELPTAVSTASTLVGFRGASEAPPAPSSTRPSD